MVNKRSSAGPPWEGFTGVNHCWVKPEPGLHERALSNGYATAGASFDARGACAYPRLGLYPEEGAAGGLVWMPEEHVATRSAVQLSAMLATYALSDVVSATCAGGRAAGGLCAGERTAATFV